jgi:hypothetical protein
VTFEIRVFDREGRSVETIMRDYPPSFFGQFSASSLLGRDVTGSELVQVRVTSGAAVIFATTTDNVTQDPSIQIPSQD